MKALVLAILLISLVSTLAVRRSTKVRETPVDTAHKIANAVAVIDDLDKLSNSESLNEAYWNAFFEAYDVDNNGLTKEEFHQGIDAWTVRNGFGHQSKPGTDAIFDDLNTDGNDVLSVEEAIQGSTSIFSWYKLISQNVLRGYAQELASELAATRCEDTNNSVAGFKVFPSVAKEIGASWDTDGDGQLSREEVESENDVLASMLFLEHLSQDETDALFDEVDADGDDELSGEEAAEFIREYLNRVIQHACN